MRNEIKITNPIVTKVVADTNQTVAEAQQRLVEKQVAYEEAKGIFSGFETQKQNILAQLQRNSNNKTLKNKYNQAIRNLFDAQINVEVLRDSVQRENSWVGKLNCSAAITNSVFS